MWGFYLSGLLLELLVCVTESLRDTDFGTDLWSPQPDVCKPGPKGRVPWILHVRDSDYGWKEHTHRAMIALAVNDYEGDKDDMRKMSLQLEVELTRALFSNRTISMHDSDLALYIHALLANNKNPRNFHGTDLVSDLLHRVESASGPVNPFLILALCNSHAIEYEHLDKLSEIVTRAHPVNYNPNTDQHLDVDSREAQMKALAFKAFACASKYKTNIHKFHHEMSVIIQCLKRKYNQTTGSFGNVYTTALAVQAFTAIANPPNWWDESKSLRLLEQEAEIDVNLIKAYYIEMALNAKKYNFIRELYKGVPHPGVVDPQRHSYYMQYTIKKSQWPEKYFTLTMKVENGTNFYDIMRIAANTSQNFDFTSYLNINGEPMVYSVSGLPNDVEENKFWRLCKHIAANGDRHASIVQNPEESPVRLVPKADEHFIYLYSNTECPTK